MDGNDFSSRMTLTWREREHSAVDNEVMGNDEALEALQGCGLLKFFLTPRLRAQPNLLEFLIRAWNPVDGKFTIRGRDIEFNYTDIYFLTELSRRGEMPILEG